MSNLKLKNTGKIVYGPNVLTSIIGLSVREVDGVHALQGRGVRMRIEDKSLFIDLFVSVFSTVQCSEVAFKIQENVKRSVESMTEYKVESVNVNILSVYFNSQLESNIELPQEQQQQEYEQ
ncbi:MAG: Asp23/Gls24 family envelope stress response protein [Clostridiales bacterium]|nr:Asp23/Gls24 family envelope stress response protein [Clostridiales bacterium]